MTFNRLEAKPIPGKRCSICGGEGLPLVKTRCCGKWVCCDVSPISIRGGGFCQFEHTRKSVCFFHYNQGHDGPWQECQECRDFFGDEKFLNVSYK